MATPTLAELLATKTVQEVFDTLLAVYQSAGFPTQSWQDGGTELTRLQAIATGVHDLASNYQPGIAAGGFTDLAPNTGWMPLLRGCWHPCRAGRDCGRLCARWVGSTHY